MQKFLKLTTSPKIAPPLRNLANRTNSQPTGIYKNSKNALAPINSAQVGNKGKGIIAFTVETISNFIRNTHQG